VLLRLFGRTPRQREVETWARFVENMSAREFIDALVKSKGYADNKAVRTHWPPGHFFSPVVDPDRVVDYWKMCRASEPQAIAGINFRLDAMNEFWIKNKQFISETPFREEPDGQNRYYYGIGPYPVGDAVTLRAVINHYRPRRIVEIGSGSSTACMLDSAEHAGLADLQITCIEPYPARLRRMLREGDGDRVRLYEQELQGMPLDVFRELEENDILFIDSTHVLKTGSDVHYELFYIIPTLKPGVLVHWHDCRFPFEYSPIQVFQKNYSWNEAYAVRLLLMDSTRLQIVFYSSLFAHLQNDLVTETLPVFLRNPGSGLWVKVVGPTKT